MSYGIPKWTCTSCPREGYADQLHFHCADCSGVVCPTCAQMDYGDCDDPMPTVKVCPACVEDELREAGGGLHRSEVSNYEAFDAAADRQVIGWHEGSNSFHHTDAYYAGGAWHMAGAR